MGWTGWLIGQAVSTTLVLGSLKRSGVIVVQPQAIKNENARTAYTKIVNIGEDMSELLESGYTYLQDRVYPPGTKK